MADVELPADFHDRYGDITPDHSGVDLRRLRRRHQHAVRELQRQVRRRRELEQECERLHRMLVQVVIRLEIKPADVEQWVTPSFHSGRLDPAIYAFARNIIPSGDNPPDG
jgi:hypothetical protein